MVDTRCPCQKANPANEARRSSPQTTDMLAIAHPSSLKRPTTSDLEKKSLQQKERKGNRCWNTAESERLYRADVGRANLNHPWSSGIITPNTTWIRIK